MRQDIIPRHGATLRSYLSKIQSNFVELYDRPTSSGTQGPEGPQGPQGPEGPEAVIDPELVRRIIFGTEEPPDPSDLPEGTIYIRYE